jgi:predicted helicase
MGFPSTIEWVMERGNATVSEESGNKNDRNDWAEELAFHAVFLFSCLASVRLR